MKKTTRENEIPAYKRKKGAKPFVVQCRLTGKAANQKIHDYTQKINELRQWSSGYGKYEKAEDAEVAMCNRIKKAKNSHVTGFWNNRVCVDDIELEFRVSDKKGEGDE